LDVTEPGPLRYAVIEVTNQCNLRCPHCASTSGLPRRDELTLPEIKGLLTDIAHLGGEEITVIGGEVFLRPDWVEICEAVADQGMRLIVITNGLLVGEEELAGLKRLRPLLIGVSLDGATPGSYRAVRGVDGFDRVVRLLHRLVGDGHEQVNAITTFMRQNLGDFDRFVELFDRTGITWQVQIANKGGRRFGREQFLSRDQYAWLAGKMRDVFVDRGATFRLRHMDDFGYFPLDPALKFLHQTWAGCIAGIELIGVRSNGDVSGCLSLGDPFVEANLRQAPLAEIWQSGTFFERLRRKDEALTGDCARCPYGRLCRAGCTSIAYSATGRIGSNPYCLRRLETRNILAGMLGPGS
jgi:radical SAM protein with 4Fe4S-binding SPASM domain